jgi:hypothetical protein
MFFCTTGLFAMGPCAVLDPFLTSANGALQFNGWMLSDAEYAASAAADRGFYDLTAEVEDVTVLVAE